MSDKITPRTIECACGHDVTSHYKDTKGWGDCLCRCDCAGFVNREDGKPYPKQVASNDSKVAQRSTHWD